MKVNIKDRVMKCYMCAKWTRIDDSGLCEVCRKEKESKIATQNTSETSRIEPESTSE